MGGFFGSLGKNIKTGLSDPLKGATDSFFDDPLVSTLSGKMGGNTSGAASDYLNNQAVQQAEQKAAAKRAQTPDTFSQFMDNSNQYVSKYGVNPMTTMAQLGDSTNQAYAPLQNSLQNFSSQAPVSANVDPAFRQYQLGLAQQLQAQAAGQGPSLAQMQLQQATDKSLNQSVNQIRSATGANAGLAARTAALAGAQQLGSMGNQSAMLRLQEQQQAQQQLAGLANQGRSADLGASQLQTQAALQSRDQQLQGLQAQRGVIGDRISGNNQVYQHILGIDAQNAEAQRKAEQANKDRQNKQTDMAEGAVFNGFSTWLGGLGS